MLNPLTIAVLSTYRLCTALFKIHFTGKIVKELRNMQVEFVKVHQAHEVIKKCSCSIQLSMFNAHKYKMSFSGSGKPRMLFFRNAISTFMSRKNFMLS